MAAQRRWHSNNQHTQGKGTGIFSAPRPELPSHPHSCILILHHPWLLELCLAAHLMGLVKFRIILRRGTLKIKHRTASLDKKRNVFSYPSATADTSAGTAASGFFSWIINIISPSKPTLASTANTSQSTDRCEDSADEDDPDKCHVLVRRQVELTEKAANFTEDADWDRCLPKVISDFWNNVL